jgi:tetratricopeptide (TPR) repeat protein
METSMRILILLALLISAGQAARFSRMDQLPTDERIAQCQKAVAADPGNPAALDELASAYLQKLRETTDFGYLDRAEKLVAQVLTRHPDDFEALILSSQIELNRHHFGKVVENTARLVTTAPGDARLWGMMGDASMEIGDYQRAASAYEQMLKLRPGLSSYNRVAWYRFVTGDAEGAIYAMRQAVHVASATPENLAWCLVDLGNLYFKTGKLTEAEANYNAALQTFPRYHPAFAGLGRVEAARHQTGEAIANYLRAQAIVPLPEYAGALRDLYLEQGKPAEARKQEALLDVVDKLARANFENTDRNLAIVLADERRHLDRALELAQNELAFRRDVYTYDALAWVLYQLKRYPEAQEAMKKALAQNTPEPGFRRHSELITAAPGK